MIRSVKKKEENDYKPLKQKNNEKNNPMIWIHMSRTSEQVSEGRKMNNGRRRGRGIVGGENKRDISETIKSNSINNNRS